MLPKRHFMLRSALALLGVIIIVLILLYLTSLIILMLQDSGVWFLPVFGWRGWYELLRSLPWILVVLLVAFVAILEILVKRYSLAYRQPLLYSAIAIVLFMLLGGAFIASTPFHGRVSDYWEQHGPFSRGFYRALRYPRLENVHRGVILERMDDGFLMENRRSEKLHVRVNSQTRFPLGTNFSEGEGVVVFGKRHGEEIQALGIRSMQEGTLPKGPRRLFRFLPTQAH